MFMILDLHILFISNQRGNMPSVWTIVVELLFILLNIIRIILPGLCVYCHYNQYNGTAAILAEWRLKESGWLEIVYIDTITSKDM